MSVLDIILTSSVTFVSIIGGFIISLMLKLSSERKSLESKFETTKREIKFKQETVSNFKNELARKIVFNWAYEIISIIFKEKGIFSDIIEKEYDFNSLFKKKPTYSLTETDLRQFYNNIYNLIEKITLIFMDDIKKCIEQTEEEIENFDDYVRITDIDIPKEEYQVWEKVYRYYKYLNREKELEKMRYSIPMDNPHPTLFDQNYNATILIDLEKKIKDHNTNIKLLNKRKTNLEEELSQLGKPEGLSTGIFLLAYYLLTTIILPIIIKYFNLVTKSFESIIFAFFNGGLVLFLFYIVWLYFKISPKKNKNN